MVTACRQLLAHPVGASARVSHASSAGSPDQPVCRRHIPLPSLGGLHPTGPPPRPSQATPADHRKRRLREAGASGAAPRTRHRLKVRARPTLLARARLTGRRIARPVSRLLLRRLSVSDRRRHQPERTRISRCPTLHLRHRPSPDWTPCSSRIPMSRPRVPRIRLPRSTRRSRSKLRMHRPPTSSRSRSRPNLRPSRPKPSDSRNPSPRAP